MVDTPWSELAPTEWPPVFPGSRALKANGNCSAQAQFLRLPGCCDFPPKRVRREVLRATSGPIAGEPLASQQAPRWGPVVTTLLSKGRDDSHRT